jgi:hypothetical protein
MSQPPASAFWSHLEQYPPVKVRLLAHTDDNRPVWISDAELAILSGIPMARVKEIGRAATWDDITLSEVRRFCAACRFDPTAAAQRKRVADYEYRCLLRTSKPMQWLRRSPRYEEEAVPLIQVLSSLDRSPVQHVA